MSITIHSRKAIRSIIDYLELPFAGNAEYLLINGNNAFLVYRHNVEVRLKIPAIDVTWHYWGIEFEIWGGGIDTLIVSEKDTIIRCYYNTQGRIKYGRYYVPTMD